jgi:hypothetical protein
MTDDDFEPTITDSELEFVENLIFDCAVDAGFSTDGDNYFAGRHGEVDVTKELFEFTALIAGKMKLLLSPNTKAQ